MSNADWEIFSALKLLTGDANAGADEGFEHKRATASWNRLNRALVVELPRQVRRAEAARRRLARLR